MLRIFIFRDKGKGASYRFAITPIAPWQERSRWVATQAKAQGYFDVATWEVLSDFRCEPGHCKQVRQLPLNTASKCFKGSFSKTLCGSVE